MLETFLRTDLTDRTDDFKHSKGIGAIGLSEMHLLFSLYHSSLPANSGQQQVKPIPTDWDNYSNDY